MDTTDKIRYATRNGDAYEIRFMEKQAPLRNTWFIFEVRNLASNEKTERGISFGRQFMKLIEDKKDVSDDRLCELALLRLKIALEREEPDATANRPRPTMDCGYDLYDADATDQPASMAAETSKFQKMLRRAHRNEKEPVVASRPASLRYGRAPKARRWGY
jgi:hypothetical protein